MTNEENESIINFLIAEKRYKIRICQIPTLIGSERKPQTLFMGTEHDHWMWTRSRVDQGESKGTDKGRGRTTQLARRYFTPSPSVEDRSQISYNPPHRTEEMNGFPWHVSQ